MGNVASNRGGLRRGINAKARRRKGAKKRRERKGEEERGRDLKKEVEGSERGCGHLASGFVK